MFKYPASKTPMLLVGRKLTRRKGKIFVKYRYTASSAVNHIPELSFNDGLAEGMRKRTIYDYYKHAEWFTNFLYDYHPEVKRLSKYADYQNAQPLTKREKANIVHQIAI